MLFIMNTSFFKCLISGLYLLEIVFDVKNNLSFNFIKEKKCEKFLPSNEYFKV
jgi:hypothetical protein